MAALVFRERPGGLRAEERERAAEGVVHAFHVDGQSDPDPDQDREDPERFRHTPVSAARRRELTRRLRALEAVLAHPMPQRAAGEAERARDRRDVPAVALEQLLVAAAL